MVIIFIPWKLEQESYWWIRLLKPYFSIYSMQFFGVFLIHKWIHFTPDVCVCVYSLEKHKKFQCRIDIWSLYLKLFHLCLSIRYAVPKSAYLFQIFRSRFSVLISFLRLQQSKNNQYLFRSPFYCQKKMVELLFKMTQITFKVWWIIQQI